MVKKQERTVADLQAAPYNPRTITAEKLGMLADSMGEFGDLSGIVWNRRSGFLVGGHQRLKHIPDSAVINIEITFDPPTLAGTVALGSVEVAGERWTYREVDVDDDRERLMNISANYQRAHFDYPALGEIVSDLDARGFDIALTGMNQFDMESFLSFGEKKDDEDEQGEGGGKRTCPNCGAEI